MLRHVGKEGVKVLEGKGKIYAVREVSSRHVLFAKRVGLAESRIYGIFCIEGLLWKASLTVLSLANMTRVKRCIFAGRPKLAIIEGIVFRILDAKGFRAKPLTDKSSGVVILSAINICILILPKEGKAGRDRFWERSV